jgi:hypothetical protein
MQIAVIKHLSETHSLEELKKAEEAFYEEQMPKIAIDGKDEGEKLTHVLAAINILEDMAANGVDHRTALRNYTQRVRNSIS